MVEQGTSFTFVEVPSFHEAQQARPDAPPFRVSHRVWLGATGGIDWLHGAIEAELGEDAVQYEVRSSRESVHIGASGGVELVILVLLGKVGWEYMKAFGGRLGEGHADLVLQWGRDRAQQRRHAAGLEAADGPPDFFQRDEQSLAAGMRGELAGIAGVSASRLALVRAERPHGLALRAIYRDTETGQEYEAVVARDSATFAPIAGPTGQ